MASYDTRGTAAASMIAPERPAPETQLWRDIYYTSRDGLRLYARHYPAQSPSSRRPALCLPGITGNSKDFHDLAIALSGLGPASRDVYCVDYRGRGRSEHDADWRNYTPYFEMLDVLDFMSMMRLANAGVVATSRGGMIAMIMATVRPGAIGAVVLNDIGPVVEPNGLVRIMGTVGRIPVPKNWAEATRLVREMGRRDFPRASDATWAEIARQTFMDEAGEPGPGYDAKLSRAFTLAEIAKGVPPMWQQFAALAAVPVLALRGENSDILSVRTVQEMGQRHPQLTSLQVPGQGHAPFLKDEDSINAIGTFLVEAERTWRPEHIVRPEPAA